jgi:hypothetical protein
MPYESDAGSRRIRSSFPSSQQKVDPRDDFRPREKIEEAKQEVKEEIAQDVDPLRDELDAVKEQNLPAQGTMPPPTGAAPPAPTAPSMSPLTPLDRMKQALEDPRYRWRSVERLSHIAGVPEADALKILRDDAAIVLGMGKSGREIARLKSR